MKPLISVLVPIYNVSEFLDNCIQSIINQSYKNLEILLLDDGSTDNSGEICDKYSEQDSRIRVIHKKNEGLSATRNCGIANCKGDFFCIVDGDDSVHPDYVSCMYELSEKYDAALSMCSYVYKWRNGNTKRTRNSQYPDDYVCTAGSEEVLREMLYSGKYAPSSWGKLFNKKKLPNIFFTSYRIGEDVLASVDYFHEADVIAYSNRPLYYYFQNENSLTKKFNPDKFYDNVLTADEIYKKSTALYPQLKKAASYYVIEKNLIVLMQLYGVDGLDDKIAHISDNIKKFRNTVIFDSDAEKRVRTACMLSYLGINNLCKIRNLISK